MGPEELRVISETLSTLGAEAKVAFIAWLVVKAVVSLGTPAIIIAGIVYVARLIVRAITGAQDCVQFAEDVAARLGVKITGPADYLSSGEKAELARAFSNVLVHAEAHRGCIAERESRVKQSYAERNSSLNKETGNVSK